MKNAVNNYELCARELNKLESRLQSLSGSDAQKTLFEEKKRALSAGE